MKWLPLSKKEKQQHIIIWVVILIFLYIINIGLGRLFVRIVVGVADVSKYMFVFYFSSFYVFNKYWGKNTRAILRWCIVLGISYIIVNYFIEIILTPGIGGHNGLLSQPISLFYSNSLIYYLIITGFSLAYFLNKVKIEKTKNYLALQNSLKKWELGFLKTQFHDHLAFNFLNYCYTHVYKTSVTTAEAIELYAELLRFNLEAKVDEKIQVEKEIEYINHFAGLQTIMYPNVKITVDVEGSHTGIKINPGMLAALLESILNNGMYNEFRYCYAIKVFQVKNDIGFSVGIQADSIPGKKKKGETGKPNDVAVYAEHDKLHENLAKLLATHFNKVVKKYDIKKIGNNNLEVSVVFPGDRE